jgi:hypothetical protein
MRFTKAREADLINEIAEAPDRCVVLPREVYREDGNILIFRDGLAQFLHRYLYEQMVGPLPRGRFLVRTCGTVGCQNPFATHREVTDTSREKRGVKPRPTTGGPAAPEINRSKTHCPQNHEYTEENTYTWTGKDGYTRRKCRACTIARTRATHKAARREARRITSPETKGTK